jgi:unsaturated rhamnogalacturonyl hydrolase
MFVVSLSAQPTSVSKDIASIITRNWKDSFSLDGKPIKWTYDMGVVLKGIEGLWLSTGDAAYYNYIQKQMDVYVKDDGTIKTYKQEDFNLDNVNNGKLLLLLYRVTLKDKYLKAAKQLRQQLQLQPRTEAGAFWHKKIYPNQQWLDGLYMEAPFYAEYAWLSHEDSAFTDIANQFILAEKNTREASTGLLRHAYDASKQMKWADATTGQSPLCWARAMGWYGAALVDALEYFPENHPKRKELIDILNRYVVAIKKQQDPVTGLWKDILNYKGPNANKNYFESSASSQFVYTIAKAVRLGYITAVNLPVAQKGYNGLVKQFFKVDAGVPNFYGTVKVSGLGGNPYRDGSFEYYMSEPVIQNDPKGLGAFLMASNEIDLTKTQAIAKGKNVVMDNFFNREIKEDAFGQKIVFHYKWNEKDNGGYYFMNHLVKSYGATTSLLDEAPTKTNLQNASVYFLIDPDWPKENKNPNYIKEEHITALYDYVKNGGVMVMMANDSNNVEFVNYNKLAEKFGIHWKENMRHDVIDNQFEQGALIMQKGNPVFKEGRKVFIKQLCTQDIKAPAVSVYSENNEVIMSVAKVGKGLVFAVGDPWFYNEYLDGRKLPAQYENYAAAQELIRYLLKNAK